MMKKAASLRLTGGGTARLENGIEVMVPQFVKSGDVIRLDLQTMKYMDRVMADARAKHV